VPNESHPTAVSPTERPSRRRLHPAALVVGLTIAGVVAGAFALVASERAFGFHAVFESLLSLWLSLFAVLLILVTFRSRLRAWIRPREGPRPK
jgi:hypothetical protein